MLSVVKGQVRGVPRSHLVRAYELFDTMGAGRSPNVHELNCWQRASEPDPDERNRATTSRLESFRSPDSQLNGQQAEGLPANCSLAPTRLTITSARYFRSSAYLQDASWPANCQTRCVRSHRSGHHKSLGLDRQSLLPSG